MEKEKKVLVGIDLNFETGFLLNRVVSFFRETQTKFYILHSVLPDIIPFINNDSEHKAAMTDKKESVENELKKAGLYYLNYEILITTGSPAKELLKSARELAVDLVVVGTHQKMGFKEIVSGSISLAVSKKSFCPILLIPLKRVAKLSEEEIVEETPVVNYT